MAAITTVISFFVLLLATLSHSAPLDIQPESSSSSWRETPNKKPIVDNVSDFRSRVVVDRQTTDFPMHYKDQSSEENISAEVTTEIGTRSPRTFKDNSFSASTDMNKSSESGESSTSSEVTEANEKREVKDVFTTTWETSTQFNQRAIRPTESHEEVESSTASAWVKQMEMTTNAEPMSSGQSFGKSTGLLSDEPSSTSENRSNEESTKQTPVKSQRVTKTISIIPGKITETKIFANLPSKTSVVVQPIEEEQLSEVQTQSNIKKTKSDN